MTQNSTRKNLRLIKKKFKSPSQSPHHSSPNTQGAFPNSVKKKMKRKPSNLKPLPIQMLKYNMDLCHLPKPQMNPYTLLRKLMEMTVLTHFTNPIP